MHESMKGLLDKYQIKRKGCKIYINKEKETTVLRAKMVDTLLHLPLQKLRVETKMRSFWHSLNFRRRTLFPLIFLLYILPNGHKISSIKIISNIKYSN